MKKINLWHQIFAASCLITLFILAACAAPAPVQPAARDQTTAGTATHPWGDIPIDRQEQIHNILEAYVGGAPQFAVYPQGSLYALEWKTLVADAGWSFDHYADAGLLDKEPEGLIIRTDKDNLANARLLQRAFQSVALEPVFEIIDGPANDIMLIVGSKPKAARGD